MVDDDGGTTSLSVPLCPPPPPPPRELSGSARASPRGRARKSATDLPLHTLYITRRDASPICTPTHKHNTRANVPHKQADLREYVYIMCLHKTSAATSNSKASIQTFSSSRASILAPAFVNHFICPSSKSVY